MMTQVAGPGKARRRMYTPQTPNNNAHSLAQMPSHVSESIPSSAPSSTPSRIPKLLSTPPSVTSATPSKLPKAKFSIKKRLPTDSSVPSKFEQDTPSRGPAAPSHRSCYPPVSGVTSRASIESSQASNWARGFEYGSPSVSTIEIPRTEASSCQIRSPYSSSPPTICSTSPLRQRRESQNKQNQQQGKHHLHIRGKTPKYCEIDGRPDCPLHIPMTASTIGDRGSAILDSPNNACSPVSLEGNVQCPNCYCNILTASLFPSPSDSALERWDQARRSSRVSVFLQFRPDRLGRKVTGRSLIEVAWEERLTRLPVKLRRAVRDRDLNG